MTNGIEYQKAVLGLIFQYEEELSDKMLLLSADDFESVFVDIFEIINEVYKSYGRIDKIKVMSNLDENGKRLLLECCESAVAPSMINDYIDCLKEWASKKRLKDNLGRLIFSDDVTIGNVQKAIEDEQSRMQIGITEQQAKENANKFLDSLLRKKQLIKTGFADIDVVANGLERGTFAIVGARPSTGKTSFALNIVRNQFRRKIRSLVFSLEMTAEMVFERMMSDMLNIDYSDFAKQRNLADRAIEIENQINAMRDYVFVLDDVYNIENICSKIVEVKPDVVVIDFIQIVQSVKSFADDRVKINYISAELKRVAKKTGCVIIALSQMTREGKNAPTMSDLRESGALEQDGDYIFILHRPYVLDKANNDPAQTEVLLDKNKFGWTGRISFVFDGNHQRFTGINENY